MIIIDDPTAFGEGYSFEFPELREQEQYRQWYEGNIATLLPTSTIDNGFKLFNEEDRVNVPILKIASDFYAAAAVGEMPSASSESEEALEWLKTNTAMLDRALRRGTYYWSIHGLGVWTAEEGFIRAVDPLAYFRVGEPDQEDSLVGHILAYRYRQTEDDGERLVHSIDIPNRVKVIKLIGELSTVQIFRYDGTTVGDALTGVEASPVSAICVAGQGDSWYGSVQSLVSSIISSLTNIDVAINRFENRAKYYPAGVIDNVRQAVLSLGMTATPEELSARLNNIVRPILTLGANDEEPPMLSNELIELSGHFEALRTQLDLFFLGSGLPPSSFGIGVGRGESGIAREKAQDAASARVRAYRRDLAECLPNLAVNAGAPQEPLSFNWSAPPFEDRSKRQQEILALLTANVIDTEEARSALGWQARTGRSEDPTTTNEPTEEE